MSVLRKRFNTAFPKLPVPPVINRTLSWNKLIYVAFLFLSVLTYKDKHYLALIARLLGLFGRSLSPSKGRTLIACPAGP